MAGRQISRRGGLLGIGLIVAAALVCAHAAGLGGLSARSLVASDQSATPTTPTILGCDDFTGTNAPSIAGRAATTAVGCSARTWAVPTSAVWGIQGNQARSTGVVAIVIPAAIATMDTAASNASVQATFTNLPSLLGSQAGVMVASNAGSTTYLSAVLDKTPVGGLLGDNVILRCTCAAGDLVSVDATLTGSHTLRLTRSGTAVTVRLDGAVVLTHTLTGAQSGAVTGGRAGLWTANNLVTVDDFVVTTPDA